MIKLTEFTSVVDTYKKNFDIRSKRFSDKKKKDTAEKIKKREDRIEPKKFLNGSRDAAGNVANKMKPGGDILDTAIRFAGFTLLGIIVKNLDKIAVFAKQVVEKVKEFAIRFKNFFNEKLKPLFFDAIQIGENIFNTFNDVADFIIEINPFRTFESLLDTVMSGIIGIATRLGILNTPKPKPPPTPPPPARITAKSVAPKKSIAPSRIRVKRPTKNIIRPRVRKPALVSPAAGIPFGGDVGDKLNFDKFIKNLERMQKLEAEKNALRFARQAIDDADSRAAADAKFFKKFGIETNNFQAELDARSDFDLKKPGQKVTPLSNLVGKPSPVVEGIKNLTKGLDFRFNPKQAVQGLFNLKNLGGAGLGIAADLAVMKGLKNLQDEKTPYEVYPKIFQDAIGMTGLVSGDRILKVRAERISQLPKAERDKVIRKLKEDTKKDDFFGNITGTNAQLKYMAEFILAELGIIPDDKKVINIDTDVELEKLEFPENFNKTPILNPNKRADEDNYDSGGNKIKIGDTVGYDISRGLNSSTTYDNQGMMISREVVIAIQPVEIG